MTDKSYSWSVWFYIRCDACRHEYMSHDKTKRCPHCKSGGTVYGLKEVRTTRRPETTEG